MMHQPIELNVPDEPMPNHPLCITEDLDLIAREKRERSVVKVDDADVPEYLWMEHLFNDGSRVWTDDKKRQLSLLVDWFE